MSNGVKKSITFSLLLLLITGCVESLHGLYSERDTHFDPALLGVWTDGNGQESLTFTKSDQDKTYKLLTTDKDGKTGNFIVHLLKLKDSQFLDIFPDDPGMPQNDFYKGHLLPTHTFTLVRQIAPTLQLADMDYDWTAKYLEANPNALAHDKVDDLEVLTAATADLQSFVLDHLDADGPFAKVTEFTHQPAAGK